MEKYSVRTAGAEVFEASERVDAEMRKYRVYGRKIPRVLYHWSPRCRRRAIRREGLRVGRLSTCRQWRPPYVCLSDSPTRALMLCPHIPRGTVVDLWQVFPLLTHRVYRLQRPRPKRGRRWLIPEWRIANDIKKSRVYWIAARKISHKPIPT